MSDKAIPLTIHNTFLLDPRNQPFFQGQSQKFYAFDLRGYVFIFLVFCGFSILLPVSLLGMWIEWQSQAALAARGVDTQATVIDQYTVEQTAKDGSKSISRYGLTIQFNADGQRYIINKDVTEDTYQHIQKGVPIPLRYLPDNPKLTQIAGEAVYDMRPLLYLSLLTTSIAIITGWLMIRNWRRKQLLAQEGQLLSGRITHAHRYRPKGSLVVEIHYCFTSPTGVTRHGKNSALRNDLWNQPLPPINRQVAVLYANDHTYTAL